MMDEIKQLSKQINVNQERLNKKIQEVFVELEELMQNADIKKITVGNLGEQLVLKEAGGNGDICLCYIPSEVEANSYDGFPIKYFILTPVFDPLYSIPSPSRYAHFGWLLTNEDFQKELVNTFSSSNTQIQQLEERIETSYSDWLS